MTTLNGQCRDMARTLLGRGFQPIPNLPRDKRPYANEWPKVRFGAEEVDRQFRKNDNIGVILGQASGGLVCVDLDDPIAVELAPQFLPATGMIAGRKKVPRSHWYYQVKGTLEKHEYKHKATDQKFIEVLGDGQQVVVGPSIHPTGDVYDDLTGEPAEIDAEELLGAVLELFYAVCERKGLDPHAGQQVDNGPHQERKAGDGKFPGDEFNERGDVRELLRECGWKPSHKSGNKEFWTRPDKKQGTSATLFDEKVFHVFTSSTGLQSDSSYSPFGLYAWLKHRGDFEAAAKELYQRGYGDRMEKKEEKESKPLPPLIRIPLEKLIAENAEMDPPVVDGIIRRCEVANIVSLTKVGKSWFTYGLGYSVAAGFDWFGFPTTRGRVWIIDNELRPGTFAQRLPKVKAAMNIEDSFVAGQVDVTLMRGKLRNILFMERDFKEAAGCYSLIIIDALYRMFPPGVSENDNSAWAGVYNQLQMYAEISGAAICCIHHSTKGSQTDKEIVDVGAGGGSQSRAADTHLILRKHEEPDAVVMDAAVRSFPPIEPMVLKWQFPLWVPDANLDPEKLKGKRTSREDKQAAKDEVSKGVILAQLQSGGPGTVKKLIERTGIYRDRLARLLGALRLDGKVTSKTVNHKGNECEEYSYVE